MGLALGWGSSGRAPERVGVGRGEVRCGVEGFNAWRGGGAADGPSASPAARHERGGCGGQRDRDAMGRQLVPSVARDGERLAGRRLDLARGFAAPSAITTLAPSRPNASAVARPMRLAAPVTNAALSAMRVMGATAA